MQVSWIGEDDAYNHHDSTKAVNMITRRDVGKDVDVKKDEPLVPRKPMPDAVCTAVNESAGHIQEAIHILEGLGSIIPASASADYFELLYHLEASQCWHLYAGAKIVPKVS